MRSARRIPKLPDAHGAPQVPDHYPRLPLTSPPLEPWHLHPFPSPSVLLFVCNLCFVSVLISRVCFVEQSLRPSPLPFFQAFSPFTSPFSRRRSSLLSCGPPVLPSVPRRIPALPNPLAATTKCAAPTSIMDHDRPVHEHALPLRVTSNTLHPSRPQQFDRAYLGSSDAFDEPPVYGSRNGLNFSHHGGDFAFSDFDETQSTQPPSLFSGSLCEGTQDSDYPQENPLSSQTLNLGNVSHTYGSGGIHDLYDVNAGCEPPNHQGAGGYSTDQSVAAVGRQFPGHSEVPRFSAPYGLTNYPLSCSYLVPTRNPFQQLSDTQLSLIDPLLRSSGTDQGMANGSPYHPPDHTVITEASSQPLNDELANPDIQQDPAQGNFCSSHDPASFNHQYPPAHPYPVRPQNMVHQFDARLVNIGTAQDMAYDDRHGSPGLPLPYRNYNDSSHSWQPGRQPGEQPGAQSTHLSGPVDASSMGSGPLLGKALLPPQDLLTPERSPRNCTRKPFRCDHCDSGFKSRKTLQRHRKTVVPHKSIPFTCKCGYKTRRKDNLQRHFNTCRQVQNPSAVFTCICPFTSSDLSEWWLHVESSCSERKGRGRPSKN
ncbi:hypothetical protein B0T11DRAFT_282625 [Plectosphaerella cucumerina]|uniref:C2H2-type domain-containing protein n=1 Tax=Plectosphaerella cucumerina TaxID=40658 RepID=A0A8K0TGA6_9PEZI|nr:hypothetical protein B0T11DRAFT_282625 [Plectosphaerella cucumerina]